MGDRSYRVPSGHGEAEFVEKRSRFIGQVWPVDSEEAARALIAETKSTYYDARHNCWCYTIHNSENGDPDVLRYADDGEPQGTAGQPMLEVFSRSGVDHVLCVVTRYFGGILLGAGGLTRAYAHTARLALDAAGISEMKPMTVLELACPYGLFERVKNEIEAYGGTVDDVTYAADVALRAAFEEDKAPLFEKRLLDMTAGAVRAAAAGSRFMAVRLS